MMERRDRTSDPRGDRNRPRDDSPKPASDAREAVPEAERLGSTPAGGNGEDPEEGRTPGEANRDALEDVPEDELAVLQDRYLRLHAEFDNYRKRVRRDVEAARADGAGDVVRAFLPLLVDLERAQAALDDGSDPESLREGIALVLRRFREGLARQGVEEIDPVGEPFDEHEMEAMSMLPSHEVPEGHVIEVFQKGLRQGSRLLEPARVVVSSGPPPGAEGHS